MGEHVVASYCTTFLKAEMLHIYFYSQGISLPHHERSDFQDEWRAVAAELGMPGVTHNDDDELRGQHRRPTIRTIGVQ